MSHVLVYPSDAGGCGYYRMIYPGRAAATKGHAVNVMNKPPQIIVDEFDQIHGITVGTATHVVLQRPASYQLQKAIPLLQARGVKVILDLDDSLSKVPQSNQAHKGLDPRLNHKSNWMHAARACEIADLVTVTTEALAEEYGGHGRVAIIPNHIPERCLNIERPMNPTPVVGWAGWTGTHVDDLAVTRGMVNQALVETGAKFAAFGDERIFNQMGIRYRAPNEFWGFEPIETYHKRLVGFDIGLVPLKKSPFNEAKSWLKGMEYAALGIVPVVSPIGDYKNLIDLGAALPAENPKAWYTITKDLILDHDMRNELSQRCRKIASEWTFESNTHKWWDSWMSA